MSTSKIGRAINPKKKINPEYGNKESVAEKKVDKLRVALDLFVENVEEIKDIVKAQNDSLMSILNKINLLEHRIDNIENKLNLEAKIIKKEFDKVSLELKESKKALNKLTEKKSNRSWFK